MILSQPLLLIAVIEEVVEICNKKIRFLPLIIDPKPKPPNLVTLITKNEKSEIPQGNARMEILEIQKSRYPDTDRTPLLRLDNIKLFHIFYWSAY